MVVRVEDLVKWSCVGPAGWSGGPKAPPCGTNGLHKPPLLSSDSNGSNSNNNNNTTTTTPDKSSESLKDKTESKKHVYQTDPELHTRPTGNYRFVWFKYIFVLQMYHNKSLPEKGLMSVKGF